MTDHKVSSATTEPVSETKDTAGDMLKNLALAKKLFAQDWPDGDYRNHFKRISGTPKEADPDWTKPDLAGRRYLALADTAFAHCQEWWSLFRGTPYDPQQREIDALRAELKALTMPELPRSPAAPSDKDAG
jgi:hypothetical protein